MTQIVYGKNVVLQLLKDQTKIHEILLMKGLKDQRLIAAAQKSQAPIRWMTRDQMDVKTKARIIRELRHGSMNIGHIRSKNSLPVFRKGKTDCLLCWMSWKIRIIWVPS